MTRGAPKASASWVAAFASTSVVATLALLLGTNACTETVTFPGLRTRFRIEEREPELAHLQSATLVIELRDGSTRCVVAADSKSLCRGL